MKNVALLGCGTVGHSVYEIVTKRNSVIESMVGEKININKILVKDLEKTRSDFIPKEILTTNVDEILKDSETSIVIEAIGGVTKAYEYIKKALENKKHVITANKAVICKHMIELLEISQKNNVRILFEASVGGGIPIVKPLIEQARINKVHEISGILNGTTNFILSKMIKDKVSFNDALKEAQVLGLAESDPTADIEGEDILRKIIILSMLAYKSRIDESDVVARGMTDINEEDIKVFESLDLFPKFFAKSKRIDDKIQISVEPVLFDKSSHFSKVDNCFNLVKIKGDFIGELDFYGQGAGGNPTGNAVVNDLLDLISNSYPSYSLDNKKVNIDEDEGLYSFYLRVDSSKGDLISSEIGKGKISYFEKGNNYTFIKTKNIEKKYVLNLKEKYLENNLFYMKIEN